MYVKTSRYRQYYIFGQVYRLRGYFWYKDAVLPSYRQSYDLVDNALTPLEEAALAHVLCSPDTSYGDVAGQMFVVSEKCIYVQYMYVCMYIYSTHL